MSVTDQSGRYRSPFRYPGGKGKLVNFIKLLMLENGIVGHDYVEPYAGGATVALSLLFEDYADEIHINDINVGVHAFWDAALHATKDLCELIERTPVTMEQWHHQRAVLLAEKPDSLKLAMATFFLNRTNRSGIIAGGVIGGQDQTGPWKLDARFNKAELIQRIRKIGRARNRIHLTSIDGAAFLKRWTLPGEHPTFLYLDPPYFVKGEGLYDNFYSPEDHARIAALVDQLAYPWLVSYDASPNILDLYREHRLMRYNLSYSANRRGLGSEVMVFASDLSIPNHRPAGISPNVVLKRRGAANGLTR